MSFTLDVKAELCRSNRKKCCQKSETYGLLFFSNRFEKNEIKFNTESFDTAEIFEKRLLSLFKATASVSLHDSFKSSQIYEISVNSDDIDKIFKAFSYGNQSPDTLIRSVFDRECCLSAFLRGAFLACGSVQNPSAEYRLSFVLQSETKKDALYCILTENGFSPKQRIRNKQHILYFKDSESIEDILTFLGAPNSSLLLMNEKIYKDIRNNINRAKNCDSANIDRTLNAVEKQKDAIETIEKLQGLDSLPESLQEVAKFRLENPEAPLSELGKLFDPPLSRSGINHRLQKIIEISEALKQEIL